MTCENGSIMIGAIFVEVIILCCRLFFLSLVIYMIIKTFKLIIKIKVYFLEKAAVKKNKQYNKKLESQAACQLNYDNLLNLIHNKVRFKNYFLNCELERAFHFLAKSSTPAPPC